MTQLKIDFSKPTRSTIIKDVDTLKLPVQIFRQGDRIVYRAVMSFGDVARHLTHTNPRPENQEVLMEDIENLTNRYLSIKKAKEIVDYIQNNERDFILPSLTVMTKNEFEINPIYPTLKDIQKIFNNEFEASDLQHRIFDVLEKFNGNIFGEIILPISQISSDGILKFESETGDGNHRAYAIHDIHNSLGDDSLGFYVGVDFYVERDLSKIRDIFIDLNNTTPIERSIYTLLKGNEPLTIATKALIGLNSKTYLVNHLYHLDKQYIGFLPTDNVGTHTKATLSFNILKNMVSYMAVGVSDSDKLFAEKYPMSSPKYSRLLRDIKIYLTTIFNEVEPFNQIQRKVEKIPKLRSEYVSLSGASLYVIAKIGHIAREANLDLEKVAIALSKLNWKRNLDNGEPNPLFLGGILSEKGNISNTFSSLDATTKSLCETIGLKIKTNRK